MLIGENMKIVVIGINHKKAGLNIREKLCFNNDNLPEYYSGLKNYSEIRESFILSTCNRVELYGVGEDAKVIAERLSSFLCQVHELPLDFLKKYSYVKIDLDAIENLLRVASGLDSMVIGESQIMGQIKKAYTFACSAGAIGPYLHKAIQDALRIGKKVRSLTNISRGVTSISGVALELIKKETDLENKKVLVIGAGKIGTLTVSKLCGLDLCEVTVINRDKKAAEELKKKCNARVADISTLPQEILHADIIIAATQAPHIINRDMIKALFHARQRRVLLIDLGVPRNIDETARDIPMVELYNIDDLAPFIEETIRNRSIEALKAKEIINKEIAMLREDAIDHTVSEIRA